MITNRWVDQFVAIYIYICNICIHDTLQLSILQYIDSQIQKYIREIPFTIAT